VSLLVSLILKVYRHSRGNFLREIHDSTRFNQMQNSGSLYKIRLLVRNTCADCLFEQAAQRSRIVINYRTSFVYEF
ncbi:MAG: hypothetical protein ACLTVB_07155, partial [Sutterella sp.]